MAPAISIVMRSHNDDRHIGRTLESLVRQRCSRSFEIVSIDDGSTGPDARNHRVLLGDPQVEPPAGPYVPGRTLNAAVKACGEKSWSSTMPTQFRWMTTGSSG